MNVYSVNTLKEFFIKTVSTNGKQCLSAEAATLKVLPILEEDSESDGDDLDELYNDSEDWSIRFLDIL